MSEVNTEEHNSMCYKCDTWRLLLTDSEKCREYYIASNVQNILYTVYVLYCIVNWHTCSHRVLAERLKVMQATQGEASWVEALLNAANTTEWSSSERSAWLATCIYTEAKYSGRQQHRHQPRQRQRRRPGEWVWLVHSLTTHQRHHHHHHHLTLLLLLSTTAADALNDLATSSRPIQRVNCFTSHYCHTEHLSGVGR